MLVDLLLRQSIFFIVCFSYGVMSCSQGISTPACLQYPWQQRASLIPIQWIGWLQVSRFKSMQRRLTQLRWAMWSAVEQQVTRTAASEFRLHTDYLLFYANHLDRLDFNFLFVCDPGLFTQWCYDGKCPTEVLPDAIRSCKTTTTEHPTGWEVLNQCQQYWPQFPHQRDTFCS